MAAAGNALAALQAVLPLLPVPAVCTELLEPLQLADDVAEVQPGCLLAILLRPEHYAAATPRLREDLAALLLQVPALQDARTTLSKLLPNFQSVCVVNDCQYCS